MDFFSKIFRFISAKIQSLFSFLRIVRLKLLYPGITIDFKTVIEKNCRIVCIKGGKMVIKNSKISYGTFIIADKNSTLEILQTVIGRNCIISSKEKISINKNCLIAEMVVIRDQDHIIDGSTDFFTQKFITAPVVIGENVWIASKATILKNVRIGKNAVIAASAVVNKNIPPFEIWGGIPATFIKRIWTE